MKKISKLLNIFLISGISTYWLLKEREYSQLKTMAYYLDIDMDGFIEFCKNGKKNNYFNLLIYRLTIPKVCVEQVRKLKKG